MFCSSLELLRSSGHYINQVGHEGKYEIETQLRTYVSSDSPQPFGVFDHPNNARHYVFVGGRKYFSGCIAMGLSR